MKLRNRTRLPDSILQTILVKAARSIGARSSQVLVQVNPARSASGAATACASVWFDGRWIDTDGGWFKIALPALGLCPGDEESGALQARAARFVHVARHEWGHVRDYQQGGRRSLFFAGKGRHDARPEEIRVEDCIYDSNERLGHHSTRMDARGLAVGNISGRREVPEPASLAGRGWMGGAHVIGDARLTDQGFEVYRPIIGSVITRGSGKEAHPLDAG